MGLWRIDSCSPLLSLVAYLFQCLSLVSIPCLRPDSLIMAGAAKRSSKKTQKGGDRRRALDDKSNSKKVNRTRKKQERVKEKQVSSCEKKSRQWGHFV